MSTAADPRGLKRICLSCGTRYYDFNKRPVICPGCSAEFKNEIKAKGRRSRAAANDPVAVVPVAAVEPEEAADEVALAGDEDTVSLEEVEEEDADEDLDEAGPDLVIDEDIEDLDDLDDDVEDEDEDAEEAVKDEKG